MSDVVCRGCGSTQPSGAPFCALCGREFPRTGRPVVGPTATPRGQVQEGYLRQSAGPGEPADLVHTGTTEQEVVMATQIPRAGSPVAPAGPGAPPYAHVGRRIVAYLLDGLAAGAVFGIVYGVGFLFMDFPTGYFTQADPEFAEIVGKVFLLVACASVAMLAYWVGMLIWEGRTGRTLGNLALGIRTVGAADGLPIGFWRALLRWLVVWVVSLVPLVGTVVIQLSPLWDAGGRRQGWHDKAAKAVVIDVRATGQVPTASVPGARASAPAGYGPPVPGAMPPAASRPSAPRPSAPRPSVSAPAIGAVGWQAPPRPAAGDALVTGVPGSSAAPAPAPAPAPVASSGASPDDAAGTEPAEATRMQAPAQRQELQPAPVAAVVLELESGERVRVEGAARVGRNPAATPEEQVRLIRVDDPSRSVSKNHADLGVDSAGLWVCDRGSTNGTVVSVVGQPPRVAEAGARVRVPAGSTIHVGDRRLTVHREQG